MDFRSGELNIMIISPQHWDTPRLSKHQYALELARLGNNVDFVNPPDLSAKANSIEIQCLKSDSKRLRTITYGVPGYKTKFHFRTAFNQIMKRQAKRLTRASGRKLDIIWDFDNSYNFVDLRWFEASCSIFHAVDQLIAGQTSNKQADFVFAVAPTIMNRISTKAVPTKLIGHGVADEFVAYGKKQLDAPMRSFDEIKTVGYVGNLDSAIIDNERLVEVVTQNSDMHFEFFGPFDKENNTWVSGLIHKDNCLFHGLCTKSAILDRAPKIDAWIACYDSTKDINGGADSHKVLEYLATGVPVVANHLDAYEGLDLLWMPTSKTNETFPAVFKEMKSARNEEHQARARRGIGHSVSRSYVGRCLEVADALAALESKVT